MEPTNQIPECEETECEEVRQVLVATYYVPKDTFIVPKGIDLNNKEQVEDHWVKHRILNIRLTNGTSIKIDPFKEVEEPVFKYPEETEITDTDELDWIDLEEVANQEKDGIWEVED